MIQTGIESRVKVHELIEGQLPEFILDQSPKTVDFLNNTTVHRSIKEVLLTLSIILINI